jgi:integrase
MASIRKRGKSWNVQIRIKGWQQTTKSFPTKEAAKQWAYLIETELKSKLLSRQWVPDLTLSQACLKYSDQVSKTHKGFREENHRLVKIANSHLGNLHLRDISSSHVEAYLAARSRSVSTGTARKEFFLLRKLFNTAITKWHVSLIANPMTHLTAPSDSKPRQRRLSSTEWDEISQQLERLRNPVAQNFILFAYETGMRLSEIISLRHDDIDLDLGIAQVLNTKNGTDRVIPLSQTALYIIAKQVNKESPYVFNISKSAIQQSWQRIMHKTGIQNLRFHDLRHEAISRFFEMGMSIAEVKSISGHKDVRQLFNYTHIQAQIISKKYFEKQRKM